METEFIIIFVGQSYALNDEPAAPAVNAISKQGRGGMHTRLYQVNSCAARGAPIQKHQQY